MLIPNHPDDERLSALASRETDATADATLTAHVSSCDRCTGLVTELGALRAALAELPDLAPSRPLQLLPPVEAVPAGAADRLGGWARRFFAPILASGAALALVGTIGTAAPALSGLTAGQADSAPANVLEAPVTGSAPEGGPGGDTEAAASTAPDEAAASGAAAAAPGTAASEETREGEDTGTQLFSDSGVPAEDEAEPSSDDGSIAGFDQSDQSDQSAPEALTVERSPWPMVLFAGVAVMIGALLLRWILVPRAG